MLFLIDENLPVSLGGIFEKRGYSVEHVRQLKQLRGKSDEAVFNYAAGKKAIIVSRDLGFTNPVRFDLGRIGGIVVLRFPNEISMRTIRSEVERLTDGFTEQDYRRLIVVEPGSVRSRGL